ncbi:MAG: GGDEF domain-containing protein [candidate division Zixibacteria bacterium]|nr:GGDEF domain-containing protein [candidate division Zixibacteria bacterium]
MMPAVLIIALIIFVTVLAVLLLIRMSREKREKEALEQLSPARLSGLVGDSLKKGGLIDVTTRISQILIESLSCKRLIFLRLNNSNLEYEYGYGVAETRHTWLTHCPDGLEDKLDKTASPMPVSELAGILPVRLLDAIRKSICDLYFPIYWGEQLYGLYFLAGNDRLRLPALNLAVASIGQTLSAMYHLDWYRGQHQKLQERVNELQKEAPVRSSETMSTTFGLLKLIRHHDSETLVGRIIDEVGRDVGLARYSFFVPPNNNQSSVRVLEQGVQFPVAVPRKELIEKILTRLDPERATEISTLTGKDDSLDTFRDGLQQAGLKYLTAFPLLDEQVGILAWDHNQPAEKVLTQLQRHCGPVSELMANAASFEEVLGLSYTDGLTGLANHRFFTQRLDEEIDRARRYGRSLALIIFDIDELKMVNDNYGHQAGDSVIRQMGQMLRASVRSNDVVARYGGDEFCIIMPESDQVTCGRFIRRFQQKIADTKFKIDTDNKELICTVSQGGAIFPDNGEDSKQLIYAADMALLEAKNDGRNGYQLA